MSVMYVKINVIIVRKEIEINSHQIPKKNCPFLQIAFNFCDAFLHVGSLRLALCVMPLCALRLCVMPFCVLALCVMPLCVLPFRMMPFTVMPFSA